MYGKIIGDTGQIKTSAAWQCDDILTAATYITERDG